MAAGWGAPPCATAIRAVPAPPPCRAAPYRPAPAPPPATQTPAEPAQEEARLWAVHRWAAAGRVRRATLPAPVHQAGVVAVRVAVPDVSCCARHPVPADCRHFSTALTYPARLIRPLVS